MILARRLAAVPLFAATLFLLAAGPAFAHAVLVSNPIGDKPLAPNTPMTLLMRFNAALEQSFFKAVLIGPGKQRKELAAKPGKDRTEEVVELPGLQPGKYALSYKVMAADSHLTEALIRFTVAGAK